MISITSNPPVIRFVSPVFPYIRAKQSVIRVPTNDIVEIRNRELINNIESIPGMGDGGGGGGGGGQNTERNDSHDRVERACHRNRRELSANNPNANSSRTLSKLSRSPSKQIGGTTNVIYCRLCRVVENARFATFRPPTNYRNITT